jgi:hypothetical protein
MHVCSNSGTDATLAVFPASDTRRMLRAHPTVGSVKRSEMLLAHDCYFIHLYVTRSHVKCHCIRKICL